MQSLYLKNDLREQDCFDSGCACNISIKLIEWTAISAAIWSHPTSHLESLNPHPLNVPSLRCGDPQKAKQFNKRKEKKISVKVMKRRQHPHLLMISADLMCLPICVPQKLKQKKQKKPQWWSSYTKCLHGQNVVKNNLQHEDWNLSFKLAAGWVKAMFMHWQISEQAEREMG